MSSVALFYGSPPVDEILQSLTSLATETYGASRAEALHTVLEELAADLATLREVSMEPEDGP